MQPVILIPARYASTRLPGKPLADIGGKPMVVHVLERAQEAKIGPAYVATDDQRIFDAVEKAGGNVVMTAKFHPSGSDRIWEALQSCRLPVAGCQYDVVVNLQGDIPTMDPALIQATLEPLEDEEVDIATLVCEIDNEEDKQNPAVVKAAVAWQLATGNRQLQKGRALYFSRAAIPAGEGPLYHHIGIYAYRRVALEKFVALPPSLLEKREKLEQLRALEAGMRIDVVRVDTVPLGVDTPEQLEQARRILA